MSDHVQNLYDSVMRAVSEFENTVQAQATEFSEAAQAAVGKLRNDIDQAFQSVGDTTTTQPAGVDTEAPRGSGGRA